MSNFFYDMNKRMAELAKGKEPLTESAHAPVAEGSTGDYSARKARAGKDIGKPGKQFAKIAKSAAERYGSKERGEKVAGAVLAKLRKGVGEAAKPDYIDLDRDGNKTEPMKQAARQAKGMKEAGPGRDMTKDLVKGIEKASGGKETAQRDAKGTLRLVKKKPAAKKTSPMDEVKLADLPVRQIKGRAYGAQPEEFDQEDDEVSQDQAPKKKGRPKGTGRKLGAKGPTGRSKLMKRDAIREADIEIQDRGEYDQEGDMAKDDIHTLVRDAQALERILGDNDNLPEWVQAKLTKARGMISAVSDYMQTQHERESESDQDIEVKLSEKAVSVAQRRAAGIARAAQKGEVPKSELRGASRAMAKMPAKELKKFAKTKEKGLPAKKGAEEVEETTVSGSVATAPAAAPKKSRGGVQFGKGIYDSMNRELEQMIAESMSVNISSSTEGSPSVSVTATDEDAAQLVKILRAAGIGTDISGHSDACPTCGQSPCGCAEQVDENQPDWPTNTETSNDALQYSGGLNKPKTDVAGAGQTTVPVTAVRVQEGDQQMQEDTCMECGMYESKCECDEAVAEGQKLRWGYHIVAQQTGNSVPGTPKFKTRQEANRYLMTKLRDKRHEYEVDEFQVKEGVAEGVNVKQIKKDLDSGMSTDAVIGKHANKRTSNTDEIRKIIQQHAWDKRMNKDKKQGVAEDQQDGIAFNGKMVDPNSIQIAGVDTRDYPDFADAYVERAEYMDGTELSYDELDAFQEANPDVVHQAALDSLQETSHDMDEGMSRMLELAGVREAAKPDFLDLDRDGNKSEPMKQAAADRAGVKESDTGDAPINKMSDADLADYTGMSVEDVRKDREHAEEVARDKSEDVRESADFAAQLNSMQRLWKEYKA